MVKWVSKNEYNSQLTARSDDRTYTHIDYCSMRIQPEEITRLTKIKPSYEDNTNGVGPFQRWFGIADEFSFHIIYDLAVNEYSNIQPFLPVFSDCSWRLLQTLDFSNKFIKNMQWIRGYEKASFSLCTADEDGLIYEFYRAQNLAEAEDLQTYLRHHDFENTLFIKAAEDPSLDWRVESDGRFFAGYPSRHHAESFALRKSKSSDLIYTVYSSDKTAPPQAQFRQGKSF